MIGQVYVSSSLIGSHIFGVLIGRGSLLVGNQTNRSEFPQRVWLRNIARTSLCYCLLRCKSKQIGFLTRKRKRDFEQLAWFGQRLVMFVALASSATLTRPLGSYGIRLRGPRRLQSDVHAFARLSRSPSTRPTRPSRPLRSAQST